MPGLSFKNFDPIFFIRGNSQVNLFIKSSRSQDGRVKQIRSIGSSYDKNLVGRGDIHLHEELGYDTIHHSMRISTISSFGDESIKFIHKYYARFTGDGSFKNLSHIFLTLAHVHVQQLRALHTYETHFALFCDAFAQ